MTRKYIWILDYGLPQPFRHLKDAKKQVEIIKKNLVDPEKEDFPIRKALIQE